MIDIHMESIPKELTYCSLCDGIVVNLIPCNALPVYKISLPRGIFGYLGRL